MNFAAFVREQEEAYERKLDNIAREIASNDKIRLIPVAGPSSSGKTTSTRKLSEKLNAFGRRSEIISIDDFFFDPDESVLEMKEEIDFESLQNIDLKFLHMCLSALTAGRTAVMPVFNFVTRKREQDLITFTPEKDQIFFVEGLHALNPLIYNNAVSDDTTYKIYLNTVDSKGNIENARLIRRIVRDFNFRNATAEFTLYLWDSVMRGERENITPYIGNADATVNTFLAYEPMVLSPIAKRIISDVPVGSRFYAKAQKMLADMENIEAADESFIPENSLLREFVG